MPESLPDNPLPVYQHTRKFRQGLAQKYVVTRVDGRDVKGQKHHGCFYFVLDLDHDPHARHAVIAYATHCREEYPQLANDLMEYLVNHQPLGDQSNPTADATDPEDEWGV
jgi:hypothetical protein